MKKSKKKPKEKGNGANEIQVNAINLLRHTAKNSKINIMASDGIITMYPAPEKKGEEKEFRKDGEEKPIFDPKLNKITWRDKEIAIPYASKQACVCKALFDKKVGEVVEWDEIAEEIDGGKCNSGKGTGWRSVYDAVHKVNEKVEKATGKYIFKTSRKSFSRIE